MKTDKNEKKEQKDYELSTSYIRFINKIQNLYISKVFYYIYYFVVVACIYTDTWGGVVLYLGALVSVYIHALVYVQGINT